MFKTVEARVWECLYCGEPTTVVAVVGQCVIGASDTGEYGITIWGESKLQNGRDFVAAVKRLSSDPESTYVSALVAALDYAFPGCATAAVDGGAA